MKDKFSAFFYKGKRDVLQVGDIPDFIWKKKEKGVVVDNFRPFAGPTGDFFVELEFMGMVLLNWQMIQDEEDAEEFFAIILTSFATIGKTTEGKTHLKAKKHRMINPVSVCQNGKSSSSFCLYTS